MERAGKSGSPSFQMIDFLSLRCIQIGITLQEGRVLRVDMSCGIGGPGF
jgi:hypothetical protein